MCHAKKATWYARMKLSTFIQYKFNKPCRMHTNLVQTTWNENSSMSIALLDKDSYKLHMYHEKCIIIWCELVKTFVFHAKCIIIWYELVKIFVLHENCIIIWYELDRISQNFASQMDIDNGKKLIKYAYLLKSMELWWNE